MVARRRIIRGGKATEEAEPEEDVQEEVVDTEPEEDGEELIDGEEYEDADEDGEDVEEVAEDDAEVEVAAPVAVATKRPIAAPAKKPVAVPAVAAKKAAVPPAPVKKTVVAAVAPAKPGAKPTVKIAVPQAPAKPTATKPAVKPVSKPAIPVADEEPEAEAAPAVLKIRKVEQVVIEGIMAGILTALESGKAIVITRLEESKWTIGPADRKAAIASAGKLVGQAYWDEVCTAEYREFEAEWGTLTQAEKEVRAKKAKVEWDHDKDPRVDAIRMTQAYREKLGIVKYKPEYQTRKQRDAVKG